MAMRRSSTPGSTGLGSAGRRPPSTTSTTQTSGTVQCSMVLYSTVLRQPQGPGPGLDSDPARLHGPQRGGGQRVRGGADHRVAVHLRGQWLQPPRRHGALPGQGSKLYTTIALHDYNNHLRRFLQNFTVDADGKPSCDYADCDLSETYR